MYRLSEKKFSRLNPDKLKNFQFLKNQSILSIQENKSKISMNKSVIIYYIYLFI